MTNSAESNYQPYMGLAEVAEFLGIPKQNLHYWMQIGKFIEPDVRLKMGPVWKTERVIKFKERQK